MNKTKQNETNEDETNAIVRLVCTDRYSEFKYKKVRNNGPEQKQISEEKQRSDRRDMRLSQHMIREHEENGTT